jgi:hypothetical protein
MFNGLIITLFKGRFIIFAQTPSASSTFRIKPSFLYQKHPASLICAALKNQAVIGWS